MRIRDIINGDGQRLRLTYDPGAGGASPSLRLADLTQMTPPILLDLYGGDLLAGYLVSARLASSEQLAPEAASGELPVTFTMARQGREAVIMVRQGNAQVLLRRSLWDRLYSELLLIQAHARHHSDPQTAARVSPMIYSRLLH